MPLTKLVSFTLLFCFSCLMLEAQYGYDIYDKNRSKKNRIQKSDEYQERFKERLFEEFDSDQFGGEVLRDTINTRGYIITDPEELKKLGASEEVIEELMRLTSEQDSIRYLKDLIFEKQMEKAGLIEEETDSMSLERIDQMIEEQKEFLVKKALSLPTPYIFGHEFFRRSMLRLFDREIDVNPSLNYVLGPGDEIQVTVWGTDDYSENFTVGNDGSIYADKIGKISVRGLTYQSAKELIRDRFQRVYDPTLTKMNVSLTYTRIVGVNIVGEVFNPGTYEFPATNSVFNALVSVDGPNDFGSVRNIFIKRNGETIKELDVYNYLGDPSADTDFFLENNDYIFVPAVGNVVNISGEIKREHNYELKAGEGLLDAIKYAGGLKPEAFTKTINIKRYVNNEEVLVDVSIDSLTAYNRDFPLRDGDSIFVYRVPTALRNYVQVVGAVKVPGRYELQDGDKISDILFKTEGILTEADLGRAYVIRLKEDQSKQILPFKLEEVVNDFRSTENLMLKNLDTIQVVSRKSFRQDYFVKVFGAVRMPGEYEYAEGLTLQDLLYLSGGMKQEAANNRIEVSRMVSFMDEETGVKKSERIIVKRLEIGTDLSVDRSAEVFEIKPHDHVFIRTSPEFEIQQNVKIFGEVVYPGDYSLKNKEERIASVLERTGGMTKYANGEGARLYRQADSTGYILVDLGDALLRPIKSKYNYILTEGDSLFIPKHKDLVTLRGWMGRFDLDTLDQISAPFIRNKSARYYVNRYGAGFGRWGKRSRTYVEQPNGKIQKSRWWLLTTTYPKVQKGATIYVDARDRKKFEEERQDRRKDRNWNDAFDSFTSKIATVLTILVLVQQAR